MGILANAQSYTSTACEKHALEKRKIITFVKMIMANIHVLQEYIGYCGE